MAEPEAGNFFSRNEKYIFFLVILIHGIPLLSVQWFLTVDGPAHLYNANLIRNYLTGQGEFISRFFSFNPNLEPNWTGHFMMSMLLVVFPAFVVEKIVLLAYVIALPVSFRMLLRVINPDGKLWSYLVFPFIYNIAFCFGFFNFCLGLPVLFFGIALWMKNEKLSYPQIILQFFLVLLAYFSHLMVCLLLVGMMGALLLFRHLNSTGSMLERIKKMYTSWIVFFGICIPAVAMIIGYLYAKGLSGYKGEIAGLPWSELGTYILDTRSIICWTYDEEQQYSVFLGISWLAVSCYFIYYRYKSSLPFFNRNDFWLAVSLFLLAAFLFVPDSAFSGGFISVRMLLIFHLFFIVWIGSQEAVDFIRIAAGALSVVISLSLMTVHMKISKGLNQDVKEYLEIVPHIKEGSTLLPLSYSDNWLHLNLSNYAGTGKNILVMDNYEGHYPQFPLRWREQAMPYEKLGSFASSKRPCVTLNRYESASHMRIDYICRWQFQSAFADSCTLRTNDLLSREFTSVFTSSSGKVELFKRR